MELQFRECAASDSCLAQPGDGILQSCSFEVYWQIYLVLAENGFYCLRMTFSSQPPLGFRLLQVLLGVCVWMCFTSTLAATH